MKTRNELTAAGLAELYEQLERRLADLGLESQPAVAARLLELSRDPGAGLADYANIVRNDPSLSGRLLRLSNSAFFAQRQPVTSVDRACVLLGLDRLRAMSLGFYLSRAAATDAGARISREVWGQSVYRACLAAEISRTLAPSLAPEAFVVGLMMDSAVPLTHKLLGEPYEEHYGQSLPPLKGFNIETTQFAFTHVDVAAVLARRWKFPEVLAKPIEWHHTPPAPGGRHEPVHVLHRVAYYVGSVGLRPDGTPAQRAPMATTAEIHLGLDPGRLADHVSRTTDEYDAVLGLFSDVADSLETTYLAAAVHQQLVNVLDEQMASEIADASRPRPQQFRLGGMTVTLRPEADGIGTAYTYDRRGEPLSTYRFLFASETVESLREALGLEPDPGDDLHAIGDFLQKLAA